MPDDGFRLRPPFKLLLGLQGKRQAHKQGEPLPQALPAAGHEVRQQVQSCLHMRATPGSEEAHKRQALRAQQCHFLGRLPPSTRRRQLYWLWHQSFSISIGAIRMTFIQRACGLVKRVQRRQGTAGSTAGKCRGLVRENIEYAPDEMLLLSSGH